jgi:hypothetical protein
MTFDLAKILQSKRAFRQQLAARPIAEKLALLDALRERQLALRGSAPRSDASSEALREAPAPYRPKPA